MFLLSFGALILIGMLLLKIPGMFNGTLKWLDALFTATSAVCVTGLAVKPICDFSFCGQLVILLLITKSFTSAISASSWFSVFSISLVTLILYPFVSDKYFS